MCVHRADHAGVDVADVARLQPVLQIHRVDPVGGVGEAVHGALGEFAGVDQDVGDRRRRVGVDQRARSEREVLSKHRDRQRGFLAALEPFPVHTIEGGIHVVDKRLDLGQRICVRFAARERRTQVRHNVLTLITAGVQRVGYGVHRPKRLLESLRALFAKLLDESFAAPTRLRPIRAAVVVLRERVVNESLSHGCAP